MSTFFQLFGTFVIFQYFTESEDENVPDESSLVPILARSIDVPDLKERSIDVPGLEEETNSFPENVLTADSQELISNITMLIFHTVVAVCLKVKTIIINGMIAVFYFSFVNKKIG